MPLYSMIAVAQPHFEDVPDLHRDLGLFRKLAAKAVELVFLIAGADADDRAAARLDVEQADLLHQPHRIVERQHQNRGAEPDFPRHAGA